MEKYIIAVRREARKNAPLDLPERLRDIPGLTIQGDSNKQRIQVEASPDAIERVRQRVGSFAYIEPVILHTRS